MNLILRLARHTNSMLICGATGTYIYIKLSNYKNCKQMLENRKDDPSFIFPPQMNQLVNEVTNEMRLKQKVKSQIKLFLCDTPDFQRHGSLNETFGALLGIPQYFTIDEKTDISSVTLNDTLTSEKESKNLGSSLYLSYEAKKFAIARELYESLYSNEHTLHILPLILSISCIFFSYVIEKFFQRNFRSKSSYIPHIIIFILGAVLYVTVFDLIILYTETNADFLACNLGKSYITGGIEYYKKMIEKNKALKKIDKNAPYYNNGEIHFSIFGKHHMPLQKRLIYLKDILDSNKVRPFIWKYIISIH